MKLHRGAEVAQLSAHPGAHDFRSQLGGLGEQHVDRVDDEKRCDLIGEVRLQLFDGFPNLAGQRAFRHGGADHNTVSQSGTVTRRGVL